MSNKEANLAFMELIFVMIITYKFLVVVYFKIIIFSKNYTPVTQGRVSAQCIFEGSFIMKISL